MNAYVRYQIIAIIELVNENACLKLLIGLSILLYTCLEIKLVIIRVVLVITT